MPIMVREKVHIPEVIEPDEKLPPDLVALRKFSVLLDEAIRIPGTKRSVGLDAGIGLIPGIGDVISGLMSTWIIVGALRHRVPMPKILRMIGNVLIDLAIGAIPVLGDVFDFVFEQNVMNMRLLMAHRNRRLPPRRTTEVAAAAIFIVIVIVAFALLGLASMVAAILWITEQRLP
jgi:hypothetical protein